MEQIPYQTASTTQLSDLIGRTLRTPGCMVLYCLEGRGVIECNFRRMPLRKGDMAIVFSDIVMAVRSTSPGFTARFFELSAPLTDETTFTCAGALLDWLDEHPVFTVPRPRRVELELWLSGIEWIESNAMGTYRHMMLRNHWHNFFLGLESVLKEQLTERDIRPISSARKIFDSFCRILGENCRVHHDVKFYADRLCISPYYLFCITKRIFATSPKELIDRQIVMEIKSLLTSTELSVKEIAQLYHFESSSYLGRYFRRHTGMTPSQYRDLQ